MKNMGSIGVPGRMAMAAMWLATCAILAWSLGEAFAAQEWQEVVVDKYGYKMKIPKEFKLDGKIDKTSTWLYQPGAAPAESAGKQAKKAGLKGVLSAVGIGAAAGKVEESAGAGSSGGLEPALTIYVNWVWMPDVDSKTSYDANLKSTKQNVESPDPDYKDITMFDKKKGYKWEGLAFWYKEVDKSDPAEIHRWHILAFGNKSHYTIGLCGTYKQFEKWGPIYEEAIKSFELIPLKKDEKKEEKK